MEKSRKSFGIMASECRLSSTVRSVDNNNYSVSILIIISYRWTQTALTNLIIKTRLTRMNLNISNVNSLIVSGTKYNLSNYTFYQSMKVQDKL